MNAIGMVALHKPGLFFHMMAFQHPVMGYQYGSLTRFLVEDAFQLRCIG